MQGSKVVFYKFPVLQIKTIWSYDWQVRLIQSLTVLIMPTPVYLLIPSPTEIKHLTLNKIQKESNAKCLNTTRGELEKVQLTRMGDNSRNTTISNVSQNI